MPMEGDIIFTRTSEIAKKNADRIINIRPLVNNILTIGPT
jgi:hypothetical protein